jgi:hypothetical protein
MSRQQVLDAWGQEWQGFAGVDCQIPGDEQMLRPLLGSKGLVVLTPGRLLGHVGAQVCVCVGVCVAVVGGWIRWPCL